MFKFNQFNRYNVNVCAPLHCDMTICSSKEQQEQNVDLSSMSVVKILNYPSIVLLCFTRGRPTVRRCGAAALLHNPSSQSFFIFTLTDHTFFQGWIIQKNLLIFIQEDVICVYYFVLSSYIFKQQNELMTCLVI